MENKNQIHINDIIKRHDLDPRLGDRDERKVMHYAETFAQLEPITLNQNLELIDGWHRVLAARRAGIEHLEYVTTETADDEDLADKMWDANLTHGVQYTRNQRKNRALYLHNHKELPVKEIAAQVGVGKTAIYAWTKEQRDEEKAQRDHDVMRLFRKGMSQLQIAEELGINRKTVASIVPNSENGKADIQAESQPEPTIEAEVPDIPQEVEPEIDAAAPLGSELAKAPQDALEAAPELEPQDATEDIEPPNRKRELDLRLGRLGTFFAGWRAPETGENI